MTRFRRRWSRLGRRTTETNRAVRALVYLAGADDFEARTYLAARRIKTRDEADAIRDGLRARFPRLRVVLISERDEDTGELVERWGFDLGGPPAPPVTKTPGEL